ncbi:hypothetical protein PENSPDRAFT_757487 [Peniophora sp. CONT]|nr:hypothetical protein PENSPDRAFT_757487 [Peniophora sp. CONT]
MTSASAISIPQSIVTVSQESADSTGHLINRSQLLTYKAALKSVRKEFKIDHDVPDDCIKLDVKCAIDEKVQFLTVSGPLEWEGIASEMKHVRFKLYKPAPGITAFKREDDVKDEDDVVAERVVIEVSDNSDEEDQGAAEHQDAMNVDSSNDKKPAYSTKFISKRSHNQVVQNWRAVNYDAPWVVPPSNLAKVLQDHIENATSPSDKIKLPDVVRNRLSPAEHEWLKARIGHMRSSVHERKVLVDEKLYDVLVKAHRPISQQINRHANTATMSRRIGEAYIFTPTQDFYQKWIASCPGCKR